MPLLVVGTDGSTNQRSGAWAWVGSDGQHGWGNAASRLIDACELQAIWQAPRQVGDRDVLMLTDSRHAVLAIRRPDAGSGRVVDMAPRVRDAMGRRLRAGFSSRVAWVRGHAGVGVNEIAHRLALNALRQVRYGTEVSVVEAVAKRIVAELEETTIPQRCRRWTATAEETHRDAALVHATGWGAVRYRAISPTLAVLVLLLAGALPRAGGTGGHDHLRGPATVDTISTCDQYWPSLSPRRCCRSRPAPPRLSQL